MLEHGAQLDGAGGDAGQAAQHPTDPVELGVQAASSAAAGAVALVPVTVEVLDVVQLSDGTLGSDFGGKPGGRSARIALEESEFGVLVLPGARYDAERLVRDVPGQGPAELPGAQPPWHGFFLTFLDLPFIVGKPAGNRHWPGRAERHVGGVRGAEQLVEGVAEGWAPSTRRGYVQIFKGFHRFLQARKAVEIEAAFGVRLVCPVDEFNASRHVGDDSPALLPPPTLERVEEFFEFLKARIATAGKYAPAARDYTLFRTLYHAGLRSERASPWTDRRSTSPVARSANSTSASAKAPTPPDPDRAGFPCSTSWTWSCARSSTTSAASSRTLARCSPTSQAATFTKARSATACAI
ncbi:hypothetical protein KJK32_44980 [Streptomyces sp. JCM17656]|nr:hypothetical protein KJK32_44980 [Streptomyces sp. JCM17656]